MAETAARPAAQPGNLVDPYRAFTFNLLIQNVSAGHFTEVTGLGVRIEQIAYREAGLNSTVRAVPGRVSYSPVTLRYGLTSSRDLWDWLMEAVEGRVRRTQVSIAMLDPTGSQEVMRWNLANAWPKEWLGSPLVTVQNELAIETMTLAHEGITRDQAGGVSGAAPTPPGV
jgi:phage tail-like protein